MLRVGSWQQAANCNEKVREEWYILSKAYEVLMVGVNVGQLNVNQQQNLRGRKL